MMRVQMGKIASLVLGKKWFSPLYLLWDVIRRCGILRIVHYYIILDKHVEG